MSKYELYDTWTPGGKRVTVSVIDDSHPVFESESGFRYTVPCFDNSGIRYIAECIKEAIRKKRNCPVLVTGDPGIGKSTLILQLMLEIDPEVTVDRVVFDIEEFEHVFSQNPFGDASKGIFPMTNMDESAHAMYGDDYLVQEQRVLAKNLIISRVWQQIVFFATPTWKLLNPRVRNLMKIWIHVFEPDYYLPGSALLKFPPPNRQSEYHSSKLWAPQCIVTFPPLHGPLWDAYEAKKIEFVKTSWEKDKNSTSILKTVAKNLKDRGMTQQEIAAIIERDRSRVSRYLSQHV